MQKTDRRLLLGLLLAGVAARVPGLLHDLWLDEIWALMVVRGLTSPAQIFTGVHFDINHWLHSLAIYPYREAAWWPVFRLPALAAGVATLVAADAAAPRRDPLERIVQACLFAVSFPLIVYSTEARGYAWLILFGLLAHACLRRDVAAPSPLTAAGFGLCAILGFLSQVAFVFTYAALGLWSLYAIVRASPRAPLRVAIALARLHLAPCLFFAWLYWIDIRLVQHGGGGGEGALWQPFARAAGWLLGMPPCGGADLAVLVVALAAALIAILVLCRRGDGEWVFYLALLVVAPALAWINNRGVFHYWAARHFVGLAPFWLMLLARGLAQALAGGRAARLAGAALLAVFCAGNLARTAGFLRDGRGHYLDALRFMAARTPGREVEVGSDHDFRNAMVLQFYATYLPADKTLRYIKREEWRDAGPRWFLTHDFDPAYRPPAVLERQEPARRYTLAAVYPYGGISGWVWCVYRREGRTPGADEGPPAP